jgi:hypothetical protein
MGSWVRGFLPLLLGGVIFATPLTSVAQGCTSDVPIVFRTSNSGSVEFRRATVRDITGGNRGDQEVAVDIGGPLSTGVRGSVLTVDGMGADRFSSEAANLSGGFNRRLNQFWETRYARNSYEFANRGDLDVNVTLTVVDNQAKALGGGNPSAATVTATSSQLQTQWWNNTNSLRRLRGDLRFRYSDFETLAQAGLHRAQLTVCVEVTGQL